MITCIALIILAVDSLPPLPDLSTLPFPEPPLWIEQKDDSCAINAYYGDYQGGHFAGLYRGITLDGHYTTYSRYAEMKYGTAIVSYTLPTHTIWLKPSLSRLVVRKDDVYRKTTAALDFSTINPWALIYGAVNADRWDINTLPHLEHRTHVNVLFDQLPYAPHIDVLGLYTNKQLTIRCGNAVHIKNFHLAVSTAVGYGFPSPMGNIRYETPALKIELHVRTGHITTSLSERYLPDSPLKYRMVAPEESLQISVRGACDVKVHNHLFSLLLSYDDWYDRMTPGPGFDFTTVKEVQEYFLQCRMQQSYPLESARFFHSLALIYRWTTKDIPFQSRVSTTDTLSFGWHALLFRIHTEYVSSRPGLNTSLPAVLLVSPQLGLTFKEITCFVAVQNSTDRRTLLYDGLMLNPRGYVAGLMVRHVF